MVSWEHEGRKYGVPAIFHATWQPPDGRVAVVLANWTGFPRVIGVKEPRLGNEIIAHCPGFAPGPMRVAVPAGGKICADLPPWSCSAFVSLE